MVLMAVIVCPVVAVAQNSPAPVSTVSVNRASAVAFEQLRGVVSDEHGKPLSGVVISALGDTALFAVSDREGRFTLRGVPPGPYLVRAHLAGYVPPRARIIQVGPDIGDMVMAMTHVQGSSSEEPRVLQAGLGAVSEPEPAPAQPADAEGENEIAWRIRHLRRSVLKDVDGAIDSVADVGSFVEDPLEAVARAVGAPVRLTTTFIGDLSLNGQINLFTRTSFENPQDLFSQNGLPASVAFVSLTAPTSSGQWTVRGGTTQGDLSSWVVTGSSTWRSAGGAHLYEAGMSYAMQRYLGGNADALVAVADGRRNASEVYGFDNWAISDRVSVNYGLRYARYDYLSHEDLVSPSGSVTVAPLPNASLRVRGAVSRLEQAPGAQEFLPPSTGVWLPPARTFSPVSTRAGFRPERVDQVEISAEQRIVGDAIVGVRVFRQEIDNQITTLFGVSLPSTSGATLGHYYVGNSGSADATGWGVGVSRTVDRLHASVDYTQVDAEWMQPSAPSVRIALVAPSVLRPQFERLHDITTAVEGDVPGVDTHVFVVYKINSGFAGPRSATLRPQFGGRFDVQVSQALPFLKFTSGQWEMLIAVRNLFREEFVDGSVYDELQVVRSPKHFVGGVSVRF